MFLHRKQSPDENLFAFSALEILSVHLEIGSTPPMCDISSIFVTLNMFVAKHLSLPFQRNWIHLFWSFLAKVIAVQVSG